MLDVLTDAPHKKCVSNLFRRDAYFVINLVVFGFNFNLFILFLRDVTFPKFQSTGKYLYYVNILAYHYQQHWWSSDDQQGNGDGTVDSWFVMQHRKSRRGLCDRWCSIESGRGLISDRNRWKQGTTKLIASTRPKNFQQCFHITPDCIDNCQWI